MTRNRFWCSEEGAAFDESSAALPAIVVDRAAVMLYECRCRNARFHHLLTRATACVTPALLQYSRQKSLRCVPYDCRSPVGMFTDSCSHILALTGAWSG